MDCALWLNKHKVYSADEIPEYPDIAALRGYYLGGSLEKWLREHNGEAYADRLAQLDCDDKDLNNALADIFGGGSGAPMIEMRGELSGSDLPRDFPCSGAYGSSRGSFSSYRSGSFRFGSLHEWEWEWFFRGGSFGSYRLGSFRLGSFHEWEWEWFFCQFSSGSYRLGSFRSGSFSEWEWEWFFRQFSSGSYRLGSFRSGSFSEWEWEWFFRRFSSGSYRLSSFRPGSFHEWEWEWLFGRGSFGSYRLGSYRFGSFGSYKGFPLDGIPSADRLWQCLDEYDRIMFINLVNCPLNRYGYGIHNI